jgi:Flp pilus assembly protein TadD
LGCIVFAVHAFACQNGFVNLDDPVYLAFVSQLQARPWWNGITECFTHANPYWHPLTWLSLWSDSWFFPAGPGASHLISALLHALSAAVLFRWIAVSTNQPWLAAATVLLWANHPLRVESVAWYAERKDVLAGLLGACALLEYSRHARDLAPRRSAWVLTLSSLAMISKPSAVVLPFAMLLTDYWPLRRREPIRKLTAEKWMLFVVSSAIGITTLFAQAQVGALGLVEDASWTLRLGNSIASVVRYFKKLFWPVDLACFYPFPASIPPYGTLAAAVLLIAVSIVAWRSRSSRPYLLFGWAWFLMWLAPAAGLIQAGRQSMADRFTYWPMLGVTLAVVWIAHGLWGEARSRRPDVAVVSALVLVLSFQSIRQIERWRDSRTLFAHAISVGSDGEYLRGLLGTSLMETRDYATAAAHLERAAALAPTRAEHHQNLAVCRLSLNDLDAAREASQRAVALDPRSPLIARTQGLIEAKAGNPEVALPHLLRASRLGWPSLQIAAELNDLGVSAITRGNARAAESSFRAAIELRPGLSAAHKNLILLLIDSGRTDEARRRLHFAIGMSGSDAGLEELRSRIGIARSPSSP